MSNNNVNDKYQKMDPVEHVLKLPDTYVSTEKTYRNDRCYC